MDSVTPNNDAASREKVITHLQGAIDAMTGVSAEKTPQGHSSSQKSKGEVQTVERSALDALARREHSIAELRTKLAGKDFAPDAIEQVLISLQKRGLLDDESFTHTFIRANRQRRGLGIGRLRQELRAKGVEAETYEPVLNSLEDEAELAREVATKKAEATRSLTPEVRYRRITGMLTRRGFSHALTASTARDVLIQISSIPERG